MSAVTEFFESITSSIRERVSSPLVGSFVLAWCALNYQLLLVLIGEGDGGYSAKLDYLNQHLSREKLGATWWWCHVGGPLAWAMFYTFLYPLLNEQIVRFTRWRQNRLKDMVMKVE